MLARTPFVDRIGQARFRMEGGWSMREGEEDVILN